MANDGFCHPARSKGSPLLMSFERKTKGAERFLAWF